MSTQCLTKPFEVQAPACGLLLWELGGMLLGEAHAKAGNQASESAASEQEVQGPAGRGLSLGARRDPGADLGAAGLGGAGHLGWERDRETRERNDGGAQSRAFQ
jgi:hypothetical protein